MPGAWRLLSHWRKLEIPNRAVPLPELAMYALVAVAIEWNEIGIACAICLGWHCILRTNEFLTVSRANIA
eukprot:6025653-Karenia_brevis.AAC.1